MFRSHLALLAVSGLFTLGVISPLAAQVGCDDWPTPAFFEAATAATVQDCLGAGADPNARAAFGFTRRCTGRRYSARHRRSSRPSSTPARTPTRAIGRLHAAAPAAAHSQTPEIVTALVNAGADPNARDEVGFTLHRGGGIQPTPEIVTALVNAGADLNARADSVFTTAAPGGGIQRDTGGRHGPCQRRRGPQRARRERQNTAAPGGGNQPDTGGRHGPPQRRRGPQRARRDGEHRCTGRRQSARHRRSSRPSSTPARTSTRATGTATHRSNSSPKIL